MSIQVISWVLQHSDATMSERIVLLTLADYAHDDGTGVYAAVESYARKARLSKRQTQRVLARLRDSGRISEEGRRPDGRRVYRVRMDRALETPWEGDRCGTDPPGGVESVPHRSNDTSVMGGDDTGVMGGMTPVSSDPSLNRPKTSPPNPPTVRDEIAAPLVVARQRVTAAERTLAVAVLKEWNRLAGQSLRSADWTAKIILRIREHPDLTLDDHRAAIERSLEAPWWTGAASPSVVYGNGALFERAQLPQPKRRPAQRYGRGVTGSELGALAERLRSEDL